MAHGHPFRHCELWALYAESCSTIIFPAYKYQVFPGRKKVAKENDYELSKCDFTASSNGL